MDKKIEKDFKYALLLSFIYFAIFAINSLLNNSLPILNIIIAIACLIGFIMATKKNKNVVIIGYIAGILMVITIIFSALIEFLLGIIILMVTYKYDKELKINFEFIFCLN